jgi:hypothetical protein
MGDRDRLLDADLTFEELMPVPNNSNDLKALGYVYDNDSHCRGCGAPIEWWITPKGKKMPLSAVIVGSLAAGNRKEILEPHWVSCPNADDFRKK